MNIIEAIKLFFMKLFYSQELNNGKPTPGLYRSLPKAEREKVLTRLNELKNSSHPKFKMADITKIINHEFNLKNTVSSYNSLCYKTRKTNSIKE